MKVLLDTSVLYPAVSRKHLRHTVCLALLNSLQKDGSIFVLNPHLIAELYSNLTRTPKLKISPDDARKLIYSLAATHQTLSLDTEDYLRAVDRCADKGLVSGVIFDALHIEAAIKAKVDVLYTANLKDFQRLMTDDLRFELKSP